MIDDHVHPFPLTFRPLDLAELTLDVGADADGPARRRRLAAGRLHNELLTARLARLLGCSADELSTARDARAAADWGAWVARLLDDAQVDGMVFDAGWHAEDAGPVSDYAAVAGRPVWEMARVEPLVDRLVAEGADAGDVVGAVERFVADAAARGAVALKTVLAYRTGLAVDAEATLADAARSLDQERDRPVRRRGKALRDLLFRTLLARAADHGLPVQVHTGIGDSDIRLREADPLLLDDVLRTPEGAAATVVLIHGSFPWLDSVGYLASVRPNVWVEASLFNLVAPLGTARRLLSLLDVAPRERILLGSDGHGQPETIWFGCRSLLDAWPEVSDTLLGAGARRSWVEDAQRLMFTDNARALYRI